MKKTKEKVQVQSDVNQNLLNIITPAGIDFNNNSANIGENYGKIFTVAKYPSSEEYGWLADFCNLEGTSTVIEYRYATPDIMISNLDRRIRELRGQKESCKTESERKQVEKAIEDIDRMIQQIAVNNEPVGYFNMMFHIQHAREEELATRIKKVRAVCATHQCTLKLLKFKQKDALKCISPYGRPNRKVANMGARNMPMSTFVGGFPMANTGINDMDGFYIGKTNTRKLVIINDWLRERDRTNSNWFISGVPGTGKSTFVKDLVTCDTALNRTHTIIWDAEKEYLDLARHPWIEGNIVDAAGGESGRINPLQIRYFPRVTEEDLEDGENLEDYLNFDDENGMSDMALYLQTLRVFFGAYFGKDAASDIGMMTTLEKNLIEVYKSKNITWETDISKLKNEDFPIISDLYAYTVEESANGKLTARQRMNNEKLAECLYKMAEGADKFMFNGHTTINSKALVTVIDTSRLQEADQNVQNAQYVNLANWSWHEMSQDRVTKYKTLVDEGYLYVDPDNPYLMKFFRNVSKRDRKYEAGLIFITHAPSDVLDPAVKRYGQAIIDNACYKFIMGCDGKNLLETDYLFHFTDKEIATITAKQRGVGILYAGRTRFELRVEVADQILEMFGKAGGR